MPENVAASEALIPGSLADRLAAVIEAVSVDVLVKGFCAGQDGLRWPVP